VHSARIIVHAVPDSVNHALPLHVCPIYGNRGRRRRFLRIFSDGDESWRVLMERMREQDGVVTSVAGDVFAGLAARHPRQVYWSRSGAALHAALTEPACSRRRGPSMCSPPPAPGAVRRTALSRGEAGCSWPAWGRYCRSCRSRRGSFTGRSALRTSATMRSGGRHGCAPGGLRGEVGAERGESAPWPGRVRHSPRISLEQPVPWLLLPDVRAGSAALRAGATRSIARPRAGTLPEARAWRRCLGHAAGASAHRRLAVRPRDTGPPGVGVRLELPPTSLIRPYIF
jgi:hypothetical protein